jgi:glutaminyl-peptide cyclotransferase
MARSRSLLPQVISVSRRTALVVALLGVFVGCWGVHMVQQQKASPDSPAQEPPRTVRPLTRVQAPKDLGEKALEHVRQVVAFGPREPGTEAWRKGLDYIAAEARKLGVEPLRDHWTDPVEKVEFENVVLTLPGEQPERIVLCGHHDTKVMHGHSDPAHNFPFVGANDGGSGVGLLLALLPVFQKQQRRATVQLVFLDGEESRDFDWHDDRALFGARRFVREHRDRQVLGKEPRIAACILLDMVGRKDLHVDEEQWSTPELREILWSAAVACGQQARFFRTHGKTKDDHMPFLDAGIAAVDIIDLNENPNWHKATDVVENLSAESLQLVGEVVLTMLPEVEREYLPKQYGPAPRSGR